MRRGILAPDALDDIQSILFWTHLHFGDEARIRYKRLLRQAIVEVARDPELPGSVHRPEIGIEVRTYHLFHSRNRVAKEIGRVKQPRHFLLYRLHEGKMVEIGRVLHDQMELVLHLPETFLRED